MSQINFSIPHPLSKEEALKRIKGLLAVVKKQYGSKISAVTEEWKGETGQFSFKAMGFLITGTLTVKNKTVAIKGSLPFTASLFKDRIIEMIQEKAKTILSKK